MKRKSINQPRPNPCEGKDEEINIWSTTSIIFYIERKKKWVHKESTKETYFIYFPTHLLCVCVCVCVKERDVFFLVPLFVKCENWKIVYIYFYEVVTSWYIPVWLQVTARHCREKPLFYEYWSFVVMIGNIIFIEHKEQQHAKKNKSGATIN